VNPALAAALGSWSFDPRAIIGLLVVAACACA
jgi:hypothetical protein